MVKEVYVDKILNKNYIMIPYKYYKYINIRIYMHYLYPYFYVSLSWGNDEVMTGDLLPRYQGRRLQFVPPATQNYVPRFHACHRR